MGVGDGPHRLGAVAFAINTAAIGALIRFLTGTSLRWRLILPGAALGGAALVVLQLGRDPPLLLPSNPLLATSRCSSGSCCGSGSSAS
jgi:membrane protein